MINEIAALRPHPKSVEVYGPDEDISDLVESIQKRGVLVPLTVDEDGVIISGHRRWRAAKEAGLTFVPVDVQLFPEEEDEWEAILDFNRQREKTVEQMAREGMLLDAIEAERAKERQEAQDFGRGVTHGQQPQVTGAARDAVADRVGFSSGRQYERARRVVQEADEGSVLAERLLKGMNRGDISIGRAVTTLDQAETVHIAPREFESDEDFQETLAEIRRRAEARREEERSQPITEQDLVLKAEAATRPLHGFIITCEGWNVGSSRAWPVLRTVLVELVEAVIKFIEGEDSRNEFEDESQLGPHSLPVRLLLGGEKGNLEADSGGTESSLPKDA